MSLQLVTHFLDLELQLDFLVELARLGDHPNLFKGLNLRSFLVIGFPDRFFVPCKVRDAEVSLDLDLRLRILFRVESFGTKEKRFDLFVKNRNLLHDGVLRKGNLTLCGVARGILGSSDELSGRLIAHRH